jgi:lysozyme family protein
VSASYDDFNTAFANVVGLEGKYSCDENDPGNWTGGAVNKGELKGTMYGISAAAYPQLDIASLTLQKAKAIYLTDYWNKLRCSTLPSPVAIALFCEGVNLGVSGAAKVFQRSLKDQQIDGNIGQITVGLATSQPPKEVLCNFLTQCAYDYTQMANFKIDGKGWLSRVIKTAVEAQLTPAENVGITGVKA